jgi:hypothetical protein
MNSKAHNESDEKKSPNEDLEKSIFLLRTLYLKNLEILDAFAGNGNIAIRDNVLNRYYVILNITINRILDEKGFEELKNEKPELFESLIDDIEDYDIVWKLGSKQAYNFLNRTEDLYILSGCPVFEFPVDIKNIFQNISDSIIRHKKDRDKQWKELLDETEPTLKSQKPIPVKIVGGKMEVEGLQDLLKELTKVKKEDKNKFPYKLPAGTKWDDFIIKFEDDKSIFIKVKQFEHRISYTDIGMIGKGNNPDPSEAWIFMKVLSTLGGELTIRDAETRDKYKKQKEILSKSLQSYFSLDYDPFYPYRSSSEKRGNSYKIKIILIPPASLNDECNVEEKDDQVL